MDVFAANSLAAFAVLSGTPTESSSSARVDTNYSPTSIQIENCETRSARFINPTTGADTSLTSAWVHFEWWWTASGNPNPVCGVFGPCIYLVNSLGTRVIRVNLDGQSNGLPVFRIDYWNGAAWVDGANTLTLARNTRYAFDFEIVCGALGSINLYLNGYNLAASLSVPELHAAVTNLAWIDIVRPVGFLASDNWNVSQILVSEEFTLGAKVGSLVPTADGTNTAWTGSFANINDLSDATVITAATAGDKESYVATDRTLPTFYEIPGVWFSIRAKKGGSNPENKKALMRVGGTDFAAGYNFANLNTATFAPSNAAFPLNPATAAAWAIADVNAAEVGFEAVA